MKTADWGDGQAVGLTKYHNVRPLDPAVIPSAEGTGVILQQASDTAGLLLEVCPLSHGLHYGSMRDTVYLPRGINAYSESAAALAGGHRKVSKDQGLVKQYVDRICTGEKTQACRK